MCSPIRTNARPDLIFFMCWLVAALFSSCDFPHKSSNINLTILRYYIASHVYQLHILVIMEKSYHTASTAYQQLMSSALNVSWSCLGYNVCWFTLTNPHTKMLQVLLPNSVNEVTFDQCFIFRKISIRQYYTQHAHLFWYLLTNAFNTRWNSLHSSGTSVIKRWQDTQ